MLALVAQVGPLAALAVDLALQAPALMPVALAALEQAMVAAVAVPVDRRSGRDMQVAQPARRGGTAAVADGVVPGAVADKAGAVALVALVVHLAQVAGQVAQLAGQSPEPLACLAHCLQTLYFHRVLRGQTRFKPALRQPGLALAAMQARKADSVGMVVVVVVVAGRQMQLAAVGAVDLAEVVVAQLLAAVGRFTVAMAASEVVAAADTAARQVSVAVAAQQR